VRARIARVVVGLVCACTLLALWSCARAGFATDSEELSAPARYGPGLPALHLAAGGQHTCAVSADGQVWCWGFNYAGQLGDGTSVTRDEPVEVGGMLEGVIALALGENHSCALDQAGAVRCWGENDERQLGDGDSYAKRAPVEVTGLGGGVSTIAAGPHHSCALMESGSVRCWGDNNSSQLGDGSAQDRDAPVEVQGLGGRALAVDGGTEHSCALLEDGAVRCWGSNHYGQLGDGTDVDSTAPVGVIGLPGPARAISLGSKYSCALVAEGGVWCWGSNGSGQLGDDTTEDLKTPAPVTGLDGEVRALSAGDWHICAVLDGGRVRCWGENTHGQLGDGTRVDRGAPVAVGLDIEVALVASGSHHTCAMSAAGELRCWGWNLYSQLGPEGPGPFDTPQRVEGLEAPARTVSAGGSHTCATLEGGGLVCMGHNSYGQLGDGGNRHLDTPTAVVELGAASAVSAGDSHTCALLESGGVRCWGMNNYGALGDGTTDGSNLPVDVLGLGAGTLLLSAGGHHNCALSAAGGLQCWGSNGAGQLGDGTTDRSSSPVDVTGLGSGVIAVSAGGSGTHTCAVTQAGQVKCWGYNSYGQLGDGTTSNKSTPVDVLGLGASARGVASGHAHSCALTDQGGVRCWGDGGDGRLGHGTYYSDGAPVGVIGLGSGVASVSAGDYHSCALSDDGRALCWGNNEWGQLGDGTRDDRYAPVPVQGLEQGVMAIAAGGFHTCAITVLGELYCWGNPSYGQLGQRSVWATTPVTVGGFGP